MATMRLVAGLDALVTQLQTNVAQALRPLLSNSLLNGRILTSVALINGTTTIPHGLGRPLLGWQIVRQRALASIYDTQDANTTPDLNLKLVSNAAVVCDIYVF